MNKQPAQHAIVEQATGEPATGEQATGMNASAFSRLETTETEFESVQRYVDGRSMAS